MLNKVFFNLSIKRFKIVLQNLDLLSKSLIKQNFHKFEFINYHYPNIIIDKVNIPNTLTF